MRPWARASAILVGALLGLGAPALTGTPAAHADNNCLVGSSTVAHHFYDVGAWCDGFAAHSILGVWNRVPWETTDYQDTQANNGDNEDGHFENEMWLSTSNGCSDCAYIELGMMWYDVIPGIHAVGGVFAPTLHSFACHTHATTVQSCVYNSTDLSQNGQNDDYEGYFNGACATCWTLWDSQAGNMLSGTQTSDQYGNYAWQWQEGLEIYEGNDSDYGGTPPLDPDDWTAGTFSNALEVYDPASGGWRAPSDSPGSGGTTYQDWRPCGTYPQGYCTNGTPNGAGTWLDNKPQ